MPWLHDHDKQQFAQLSLAVLSSAAIRSVGHAPCIMGFSAQIYFQISTQHAPIHHQNLTRLSDRFGRERGKRSKRSQGRPKRLAIGIRGRQGLDGMVKKGGRARMLAVRS